MLEIPRAKVAVIPTSSPHAGGSIGKGIGAVFSLGISMAKQMAHTESYFTVRIRTQGRNYIVCCGSTVCQNRCNKAGIQIRGEDGVLGGLP